MIFLHPLFSEENNFSRNIHSSNNGKFFQIFSHFEVAAQGGSFKNTVGGYTAEAIEKNL